MAFWVATDWQMANKLRRCWDSACCFGFLSNQSDRATPCERVLRDAEEGKCEIIVSALAIAEVLHLRGDGHQNLFRDSRDRIRNFFKRSYFIVQDVDRFIAEHAQELFWDFNHIGVMPKDAVHVATALATNCAFLETFDEPLLGISGSVGGDPRLIVQPPGHDLLSLLEGGVEPGGQLRLDKASPNDDLPALPSG